MNNDQNPLGVLITVLVVIMIIVSIISSIATDISIFQMCAILPGLSRSGSTITGGRLNGLKRTDAVRFSFLMSIPAILGSCVTELPDMFADKSLGATDWLIFLGATVVACLVGIASMKLLQFIANRSSFKSFSYYCWAVGAIAIVGGILLLVI